MSPPTCSPGPPAWPSSARTARRTWTACRDRLSMREEFAVHGALSRGVFAVVVLVSLAVLFAPGPAVPSAPAGVDKVVHVTLFAALALSGRWAGIARGVLATLLPVYAAA